MEKEKNQRSSASRPDRELIFSTSRYQQGHYYNNQYFMSPNERHIIGPYVATDGSTPAQPSGEVTCIVAQTFTRVSYDVPAKYKRPSRKR